jgi:hypothetical protein
MIRLPLLALLVVVAGCAEETREEWCAKEADLTARLQQCEKEGKCGSYISGGSGLAGSAAAARVRCNWKEPANVE